MIRAIKLKNCIPYQEAEISECKKINYIFGSNGSGKSTIGAFLSGDSSTRFDNSSIEWEGENHEKIEVYNKSFRQKNLQQEIQGIFTLGSATIDDIQEVEKLKEVLAQKTKEWEGLCRSYQKKNDEEKPAREERFKEDAWNQILKRNENDFQKAFEGLRRSKEKFVSELQKRINGIPNHRGTVCDRQDLIRRAQTLYSSKSIRCERLSLDVDMLMHNLNEVRNDVIWETVIIGSADVDIAPLITELGNSSWVGQGRQYLRQDSMICPFCQHETINESFRHKLESFFDTEYKRKIEQLTVLLNNYKTCAHYIIEALDASVQDKDDPISIGKLNIDVFIAKKELLESILNDNIRRIEEKTVEPEKKIQISCIDDIVNEILALFANANTLIDSHNDLVDQRDIEEVSLRDDVWATCMNDVDSLIKAYLRDMSGLEKAINGIKKARDEKKREVDQLKSEVEEKGKNITSVQPAIDEINRSLKAYGFTNFSIQPAEAKENYYCIKRDDGTYATNTLSEGEETFLTFLFFMQRTKGATDRAHVSDKRIIVLDDPISSLDSTILYVVGAIVKDLSEKIRKGVGDVTQLFVLTHNVFFHKEASFIDRRTKEVSEINYWIVRKNSGVSTIDACGMKNPISTSYELLWKELQNDANTSLISIQNTMRRILENYFRILGRNSTDYLIEKFDTIEDKMIARSLLCWINDGSHSIPDDLFIDSYTDAVPRYKEVFRNLFDKSDHIAHYNMMMGVTENNELN